MNIDSLKNGCNLRSIIIKHSKFFKLRKFIISQNLQRILMRSSISGKTNCL